MNENTSLIKDNSNNSTSNDNVINKDINSEFNWKNFKEELYKTIQLSWPILLSEVISNIPITFNLRVAGRLGTYDLAASTLSMTLFMIFGLSPLIGILTALETLQSQAFTASTNKHKVGLYSQRALLIVGLLMVPISICFWRLEDILLALNQNPDIAKLAGVYMRYFIPAIPVLFASEIAKRFLFIQGIMRPNLFISIFLTPFHLILLSYLTSTDGANLGLRGIPITMLIVGSIHLSLHIITIKLTSAKNYWGGFSTEAFKEIMPFIRLGFPGMLMMATAMWPIEIITFTVSYFGPVPLSSQAILNITYSLNSLFTMALSTGTSIRIGNLLGANQPNRARMNSRMIFSVGLTVGLIVAIGVCTFRKNIIRFYSTDPDVLELSQKIFIPLSFGMGFHTIATISGAVLRGQGHQHIIAFYKVTACFLISLPIGWYLALFCNFQLLGLWIGIIISWMYTAIGESYTVLTSNWKKEVIRCLERVNNESLTVNTIINTDTEALNYGSVS